MHEPLNQFRGHRGLSDARNAGDEKGGGTRFQEVHHVVQLGGSTVEVAETRKVSQGRDKLLFDVLREVALHQVRREVSHVQAVVFVDVPNDVHGTHLKRQHTLRPAERGRNGRLVVQHDTNGPIRKTVPRLAGERDAAVRQEVGLAFSRNTLDVGLPFNQDALIFQTSNGSGYVGTSDGHGVGNAHLRKGKGHLNAVLEVGIVQQVEQDAFLHAGFRLCGHTSTPETAHCGGCW